MDPSVLLRAYKSPQWPDPVEEYKGFLSLRQMMDLGKLRQVQLKQEDLQNQQIQQQLGEYNEFRNALPTLGENPTPSEVARYPTYGLPYLKSLRETQTAALNEREAREKLMGPIREDFNNGLYAISQEPDAATRQEMYAQLVANTQARAKGIITPGFDSILQEGPPSNATDFLQMYRRRYGPEKTQKYLDQLSEAAAKREDRTQKQLLFGPQYAKAQSDAITARTEALGEKPATEELTFKRLYYPGYLKSNNLPDTAENRMKAYEAFEEARRPRIEVPGTDVPYSPPVQRQKEEMARNIAANKPQNAAAFKTKTLSLKNLEDTLGAYKKELETTGPTFRPEKGAKLKALYTNVQMAAKNLYELGVITGPDMQILQGAISDPTGFQGNWLGTDALLKQLEVMSSLVSRSKNNLAEVYGQEGTPTAPPAAVVQWERGPDGKPRRKQ